MNTNLLGLIALVALIGCATPCRCPVAEATMSRTEAIVVVDGVATLQPVQIREAPRPMATRNRQWRRSTQAVPPGDLGIPPIPPQ